MNAVISKFLDRTSEFLAHRKGLLPMVGLLLIFVNLIIRLVFPGWLADSDIFLHVGIILALLGFLFAKAL
jgi:hypothetical protein